MLLYKTGVLSVIPCWFCVGAFAFRKRLPKVWEVKRGWGWKLSLWLQAVSIGCIWVIQRRALTPFAGLEGALGSAWMMIAAERTLGRQSACRRVHAACAGRAPAPSLIQLPQAGGEVVGKLEGAAGLVGVQVGAETLEVRDGGVERRFNRSGVRGEDIAPNLV